MKERYHQLLPQAKVKELVKKLREKKISDRSIPSILEERFRQGEFKDFIQQEQIGVLLKAGVDLSPYPFLKTHLKTSEAAERLGVTAKAIQRMMDRGELPFKTTEGGHRLIPESAL